MAFSLRKNLFKFHFTIPKRNFRMSATQRAEEAIEELKTKNPFFEKYASKLAAAQQSSPEEFLKKVEERTKTTSGKKKETSDGRSERHYSELVQPKSNLSKIDTNDIPRARLNDILKLDMIKDKSVEEITELWLEYHKQKDCIAAAIPVEHYETMFERFKAHPLFIFALPRTQGYEFIMLQFSFPNQSIHFTPLLCYQVHKENAPECLNIVHFTELRNKGLILMRGEYDSKVINIREAQCLANQLQLYYTQNNESKLKLLETFTKNPEAFKHMDIIHELETLTI